MRLSLGPVSLGGVHIGANRAGTRPPGLEAGAMGRRLSAFVPSRTHVNGLIEAAGRTVTARARWLARNNAYAANAVRIFASNAVGAGIVPSWRLDGRARLRAAGTRTWTDWTDEADAEGLTDFYGLQRRAARELFIGGECFFRLRPRRASDGLTVPLQLQMLPSEMVPLDKNEMVPGRDGWRIRQGIEFDALGRRVAYHVLRRHPEDPSDPGDAAQTTRVPASEMLHLFDPVEAGQIRGLSMLAAAVVKLFVLDQYDDAELERKKTAALVAGFIKRGAIDPDARAEGGERYLNWQPGMLLPLEEGEDIVFADPADVGGNYEAFQYRSLLAIAAATGLPYAALTGDLVKANYANTRAGLIEFRRVVEAFQHAVMVYQLCRPVWRAWLDQAVLAGSLRIPGYAARPAEYQRVRWITPAFAWVDPKKDREAEAIAVQNGFKSRSAVIEAEGNDPEEVDAQIAADRAREARLGLAFPSAAPTAREAQRPANSDDPDAAPPADDATND